VKRLDEQRLQLRRATDVDRSLKANTAQRIV